MQWTIERKTNNNLHRKIKIEQHEPQTEVEGLNSGTSEGWAVPVLDYPYCRLVIDSFLLTSVWQLKRSTRAKIITNVRVFFPLKYCKNGTQFSQSCLHFSNQCNLKLVFAERHHIKMTHLNAITVYKLYILTWPHSFPLLKKQNYFFVLSH